jgi:hypothetical protein
MVGKPQFTDEGHKLLAQRQQEYRERKLTQNQQDAIEYLKTEGNFIKVHKKQIEYVGQPSKFIIQRNTFTSLCERGLLRLDHGDKDADYYTIKSEVYTTSEKG